MIHFDDISDDEIRIIGNSSAPVRPPRKPLYRRWWFWVAIVAACLLVALTLIFGMRGFSLGTRYPIPDPIDPTADMIESGPVAPIILESEPAVVITCDTVINDVPLHFYMPVNAVPELRVGYSSVKDTSLVLAFQAADVRADNNDILGAFVLKGELLARGHSKKGFCAIINGNIQLGMAESTPLLEEATEKEGYFFRQYPLVLDGQMVENKPKNKAVRHALCEWNHAIMTVSSQEKESLHDFAQALADLGIQNAIYLVGDEAYGFCRTWTKDDATVKTTTWGMQHTSKTYEKVNFIVWRVPGN